MNTFPLEVAVIVTQNITANHIHLDKAPCAHVYMCVSACQGAALEIFPQALAQAGPPFSGLASANNIFWLLSFSITH